MTTIQAPSLGDPTGESNAVFWTAQSRDHAQFLFLMIEDNDLARRAKSLQLTWENVQKVLPGKTPQEQAGLMVYATKETRGLLTEIIDRQAKGEWLGWAWPRFVEHLLAETDYAWRVVSGQLQHPEIELCTWLGFMADHAAFAAQLLDPTEAAKINDALRSQSTLSKLGCACSPTTLAPPQAPVNTCASSTLATLLTLSKKAGDDLDAYLVNLGVGTPKLRSIIHPVLAIHVVREGRRFLSTLERLKANV